MPRPVALKNGVYHLNVRVPVDLARKLKGERITLPLEGRPVTVRASDKVVMSLRTKDGTLAKSRFSDAAVALQRHFEAVRAGPKALPHKQIVALAGEVYRRRVAALEDDVTITPDSMEAERREVVEDVLGWRFDPDDGFGEIPLEDAFLLAGLARPGGPQLLAFELNRDIQACETSISLDESLAYLFGREADQLCAERGVVVDAGTRVLLLREIGRAVRLSAAKLERNIGGDYSPDPNVALFPPLEVSAAVAEEPRPRGGDKESVLELFERWKVKHAGKKSASTIRRYTPSVVSLNDFVNGGPWRRLTDRDLFAWATHRHEVDGLAPATVNRNDLVAVASVLAWPTTLSGGKSMVGNAAKGVKLDLPKKVVERERVFRTEEIKAILTLARAVVPDPRYPRASASRRWCPWLCAYSGARVQEVLWLKKDDVRMEAGVNVMCLPRTKDGHARMVPLHTALIGEGFLDFVARAPEGWLFVGDRSPKPGASRTIQEMRAAELAAWVRSKVELGRGVSPNHGWRHTWITYAEGAGIPKRLSNRITGHNMEDVSGRYVGSLIPMLAAEMVKFPRYDL